MATVQEVWKSALPRGTKVVAGDAGLSREVSWVAMLRPTRPAFDALRGGELALVSLRSATLLDRRLTLSRLMESLAETGVTAVAVLGNVSAEAKEVAQRRAMPLLALPAGSSLHGIEQAVLRLIIERRTQLYQREHEISRQLTELAIQGKGIPAIAKKLCDITGKAVVVADEAFEVQLYIAPSGYPLGQEEAARLLPEQKPVVWGWLSGTVPSTSDPPTAKFELSLPGFACLVAPIGMAGGISNYLAILGRENELAEVDRLAVARGAAACAIEAARARAMVETEDRMQADFLDDLLSGNFATAEAISSRAKRFGYDLASSYAVLVLRVDQSSPVDSSPGIGDKEVPSLRKNAAELVRNELASRGVSALCQPKGDAVILLYPVEEGVEPSALKRSAETIGQAIRSYLKGTLVSIGIGRFYPGLEGLSLSYREAEQALAMGAQLFGAGNITYFGDIGVYRLLLGMQGTAELESFYQETLGSLVEYDRKRDSELVKTLEAYFACRLSPTEAAKRLHIHRNTLLYRLGRIKEVSGLDLDDPETRLTLHLALKVGETLRAVPRHP